MSNQFELTAELRGDFGKGASRRLRRAENKIPAILYGADQPPVAISFMHKHVTKALENDAFYSHILTIHLNGEKHSAVLKAVQQHPYKPKILHLDLLRINPKEKITMQVPLHFVNQDIAPGVKVGGGIVLHLMNSVEIRCLPSDLPEFINVDLSQLELGDMLHLSDLKLPNGVELLAFTHGDTEAHNLAVVKIDIPRATAEEPAATPEAAPATTPAAAAPETKK